MVGKYRARGRGGCVRSAGGGVALVGVAQIKGESFAGL